MKAHFQRRNSQSSKFGCFPYSITQVIEYALTNSTNSEMFDDRDFFKKIDKVFSKFVKVQSPKTLREIDLQWEIDLSIQSILIKGNTTESIEYAPNGRIILGNRRSFFKKKTRIKQNTKFHQMYPICDTTIT